MKNPVHTPEKCGIKCFTYEGVCGKKPSLHSKRFCLLLCVLVLVNGARGTFDVKVGARAKSERSGEG